MGDLSRYSMQHTLGDGVSACVRSAIDTQTKERVALKLFNEPYLSRKRNLRRISKEVMAMKAVSHPNVLKLIDTVGFSNGVPKSSKHLQAGLVLEEATHGDLYDFVSMTGKFSEAGATVLISTVLKALQACHNVGVYHKDVKPENLLVNERFDIKLADFGFATYKSVSEGSVLRSSCGTRCYAAPEVLRRAEYDARKIDVWSAGICLFVLLAGHPPFTEASSNDTWFQTFLDGRSDEFWAALRQQYPWFPEQGIKILSAMLNVNSEQRPTATELLKEDWLCPSEEAILEFKEEMKNKAAAIHKMKQTSTILIK
eukprot:CAMPEP_0113934458 /NCGR_PEP_ID=MMETSP1339-20121228/1781_1 /TAXON_ID=94617 /ORGANISM="Fibrocapsa japonica" /LENGTH=312 /DNA_ID=CAMNT_0000936273 /DNA_START=79 /DNA_END=1017 /DNA_ORIENTATION=+ /assembly_acc=CAM_ASM_000762